MDLRPGWSARCCKQALPQFLRPCLPQLRKGRSPRQKSKARQKQRRQQVLSATRCSGWVGWLRRASGLPEPQGNVQLRGLDPPLILISQVCLDMRLFIMCSSNCLMLGCSPSLQKKKKTKQTQTQKKKKQSSTARAKGGTKHPSQF